MTPASVTSLEDQQTAPQRRLRSAPLLAPPRRESTSSVIRRVLRDEIISMLRKPGDPISEKALAAHFGVSRTPVREALLALSEEGLIDIFPQSGTFVARIPLSGMPEAMLIRESLEQTIVRLCATVAGRSDIAMLDDHLRQQRDAGRARDFALFHQLDEGFHALLANIAGYPGVWSLVQQVKIQIDRFRLLTLTMANRPLTIVEEHSAIVDGIATHDADAASAAMARHLDTVRSGLDAALAENPDFFADDASPAARQT